MKGKIDGHEIADRITRDLEDYGGTPRGKVILVGDDPASRTFVEQKKQLAEELGFELEIEDHPADVEQENLLGEVRDLAEDDGVDGILVQLPLPEHIDENKVFGSIPPGKDIDGLTPENLGKLMRGSGDIAPAAVKAVLEVLDHEDVELEGSDIAIVNDSPLIGRPLAMALIEGNATVQICHEKTEELAEKTRSADIVITATGQHGLITSEMVKEDAVVIDAGYEHGEGDIREADEIADKALIAEVPGGLGPVTVACTMENLKKLHED